MTTESLEGQSGSAGDVLSGAPRSDSGQGTRSTRLWCRVTSNSCRPSFVAPVIGLACFLLLLATSPGLPMVWDEANAIRRAGHVYHWVDRWFDDGPDGRASALTEAVIREDWRYTTQVEGHPAFYGTVIAFGTKATDRWLDPLQAARFGPIVFFSIAVGALYYRMARQFSQCAAIGTVAAIVLLPRLFAHAHFASFDGPLTSAWILSYALFAPACNRLRWAVVFGIVLGMTLSCKATGFIAPFPFVVWAIVYRDRRAIRALALAAPVTLITFFVLNPPLWHHPVAGVETFLGMNFNRDTRLGLNIPIWFLGQTYDM